MESCLVNGCDNPAGEARGYCVKHYNRWRRHGDPLKTTRVRDCFSITEFVLSISQYDIENHIFKDQAQWANACKIHYGDHCSECGWDEVTCDVHHRIPKNKGGKNTIANGNVTCPNCHAKQHRRKPIQFRRHITRA